MPSDYAILANIYDTLGMSASAANATPRLLDYAQRSEWMGRRILDLGSGTGAALEWLGKHGYITTGINSSPEMINAARTRLSAANVEAGLRQQDIRRMELSDEYDMILALNVLNELDSLRDLEAVFKGAHQALASERMFIFNLTTLEGLAKSGHEDERILYDDPNSLVVVTRSAYDYERQALTRWYMVFARTGTTWTRHDTQVVSRGYPIQAVASLLQRCGLELLAALTPDMTIYEPGAPVSQLFLVSVKR